MEKFSSSLESSSQVEKIATILQKTCDKLFQAMEWTFDTLTQYGTQAIQGVSRGVNTLFVDVIVRLLNKIATLVRELSQEGSEYAQQVIAYYHQNLEALSKKNNFFHENFSWRVHEIFA